MCGGEGGDDDDGDGGADPAQLAQDADAVLPGHRQVEREHIGAVLGAERERLVPVPADPDHLGAALGQRVGDEPAHERGIVCDDDADRL